MQRLKESGQLKDTSSYQGSAAPPDKLDLHFIPFKQGMLYVGNTEPLTEDELDLVKSLAEAFSIAYARYEDFRELEIAKNQIEETLNELKATQSQLIHAEKMASLGELTAGIAHEIQNPLNFVNNFSDVSIDLIEELKDERNRKRDERDESLEKEILDDVIQNLEKINHHGLRASSIVKGMLEHSRSSSKEKQLIDINALADEYLRLAYHGLRAKDKSFNADFSLEKDDKLPEIKVIPQDIGRVLLNLINNAFYAVSNKAKEGINNFKPQVIISTRPIQADSEISMVEIRIRDNGNGIPKDILDKIFQPFFTTKPTGQGTGLGLSLSYDIVKAHGGE
jgi:signal transduction histidine kinase